MKQFENKDRNRYYGLRVGDIISSDIYNIKDAKVIKLDGFDNNRVTVVCNEVEREVVAEWCKIITKVDAN
jgi:hypothetical protein